MTPGNRDRPNRWYSTVKYVYVNCWSYQNRLLKIDTRTGQGGGRTGRRRTTHIAGDWMPTTSCGRSPTAVTKAAPTDMMFRHCTASTPPRSAWKSSSVSETGTAPSEVQLNGATRHAVLHQQGCLAHAGGWPSSVPVRARSSNTGQTKYLRAVGRPGQRRTFTWPTPSTTSSRGSSTAIRPTATRLDEFRVGIIPGAFCW